MNSETEDQQNLDEANCKIKLLDSEYENLRNYCQYIERELTNAKSQIKSMKLALTYSDSFSMRKETDMREEIERLKQKISEKVEKKKKKESILTVEISKKTEYIDDLMAKIQNLHQKSEYYKEDLFKYQDEYSKTKDLLDIETRNKEKITAVYEENCKQLMKMQSDFQQLTQDIENYKKEKEEKIQQVSIIIENQAAKEISEIRETHQREKEIFLRENALKIENLEANKKILLESLKKYTEKAIDNIRRFYEDRISQLINEISFAEGRYQAELVYYKNCISSLNKEKEELLNINKYLAENAQQKIEEKISCEIATKALVINSEEKITESKLLVQRNNIEMEDLKIRYDQTQKLLIAEYEKMVRLNIKNKDDQIERQKDFYEYNISKIKQSIDETKIKKRKHYEIQIEFLLNQINQLEKDKSNLELEIAEKEKKLQIDTKNVFFI